jgi:hypothetical protein
VEVTKATENEIVNLISKHINSNFECIVSNEELDNQEWCVYVTGNPDVSEEKLKNLVLPFQTVEYLNQLAHWRIIPTGDYIIDCTW